MATDPIPPVGEDDLHALVDGRLDAARLPAVRRFLAERPDEAARVRAFIAQRDALRAALAFKLEEPIPARLRVANIRAGRRRAAIGRGRLAAAAAVLLMIGTGFGWVMRGSLPPAASIPTAGQGVAQRQTPEAPAPRMQALARNTDLAAWLQARLGEPLLPPDLTGFGLTLQAARIAPGSDGPAVTLLYEDADGTPLSLRRRPTPDPVPRQLRCADEPNGLLTYTWSDGQWLHAVTAAMPRDRLRPIAQAIERDLQAPLARDAQIAGLARRPCDTATG